MRSLILYYTYHGNTQRIAERIHAAIGGDIARIDTVAPYTGDYDDVVAQGEREVKRATCRRSSRWTSTSTATTRSCSARPSGGTPAPPPCVPF